MNLWNCVLWGVIMSSTAFLHVLKRSLGSPNLKAYLLILWSQLKWTLEQNSSPLRFWKIPKLAVYVWHETPNFMYCIYNPSLIWYVFRFLLKHRVCCAWSDFVFVSMHYPHWMYLLSSMFMFVCMCTYTSNTLHNCVSIDIPGPCVFFCVWFNLYVCLLLVDSPSILSHLATWHPSGLHKHEEVQSKESGSTRARYHNMHKDVIMKTQHQRFLL